ncbi:MAG: ribonuclease HII, partial [Thermoprotei archaeon ex4572_64]
MKLIQNCLDVIKPVKIFLDSPDPKPERYESVIRNLLKDINIDIHALNRADENITVVSLASILAKIIREREVERLRKIYGDFGSGYPSD